MNKYILILVFLMTSFCFSQKLNENYLLFSNGEYQEYIEFKNDSVLIRKPYYPENYCFTFSQKLNYNAEIYKEYNYTKKGDSIIIKAFDDKINSTFKIKDDKYFESFDKVYILRSEFEKFPETIIRFENQDFLFNSNSIVDSHGKKNKRLQRLLRNKEKSKLDIKIYKSFEAFQKFGYRFVFGIIDVTEIK